ncbi:MAG: DegQ family serine endoprotease [Gammaproteobacteria bacterium]|nr:DegQ family serine endoprotease [Gammaproteobacteria bacterium]
MLNAITKSIVPVLKWGTVIVTTAVVVISIQVYADGYNAQPDPNIKLTELVPAQPGNQDPNADSANSGSWSPANGFADLIEQVSPAVVHVAISGVVKSRQGVPEFNFPPGSPFEDFFEQFRNRQQPEESQRSRPLGIGSGFIISEDGYVVTNHHVIKDADEIVVTLTNGKEYQAELRGSDNKTDLALLKLKNAQNLPYVAWGDDDQSRVGDWVLAIGNPFGLGGTATTGIISARGRDIQSGPYDDYIQVDAAINRGNSGGPLFNLRGEVIGINTAIYSPNGGSVGIGFSIPSSLAKNVITQLRDTGEVERAWIGVEIQALSKELAEGFERDNDHGALITSVVPGKPADQAGMQAGDIILSFDGKEIKKMRDLPRIVAQSPVGKKYKVGIWRDGKSRTLTIKTDRYPDDLASVSGSRGGDDANPEPKSDDVLGATLSLIDDELRARYRLDDELSGVVVVQVNRDGLAARNGIRIGDVITSVNNVIVSDPAEVVTEITKARKSERKKIVVLLQRNNSSRFIAFDLSDE